MPERERCSSDVYLPIPFSIYVPIHLHIHSFSKPPISLPTVQLSPFIYLSLSIHPSIHSSNHNSVHQYISHLLICSPIHPFIYLFTYLYPFIYVPINPSLDPSINLFRNIFEHQMPNWSVYDYEDKYRDHRRQNLARTFLWTKYPGDSDNEAISVLWERERER